MSKITVAGVRGNVKELLEYSNETKKRNFLEVRIDMAHLALGNISLTSIATDRRASDRLEEL